MMLLGKKCRLVAIGFFLNFKLFEPDRFEAVWSGPSTKHCQNPSS